MITRNAVSITDLLTFLLYINIFTDPVKTLIDFTEQLQNGYSGYERFQQILQFRTGNQGQGRCAIELKETLLKGNISFDNVSFSEHNDNAHRVFKHINLDINAGEYVALVGSSGAGKSTLCNLIPRFYEDAY